MEIYVVRHTQVKIGTQCCYGQADVPLADSFKTEVENVQGKLPSLHGSLVYSSPLNRCRKLAEQLSQGTIQFDPRLMELDFGAWELKCWDEIDKISLKTWTENFVNQGCPDGESFQQLFTRVIAFWEDVCLQPVDLVLVVTHAGVIRALLAHLLHIPLEHVMRIGIDYGGVSRIHLDQYGPIVHYINR